MVFSAVVYYILLYYRLCAGICSFFFALREFLQMHGMCVMCVEIFLSDGMRMRHTMCLAVITFCLSNADHCFKMHLVMI